MSAPGTPVTRDWLALREPADAEARSPALAERLRRRSPPPGGWLIHDLGCGTGAMARWLAPLLSGPQRWVLHDLDADLLAAAAAAPPGAAADGAAVRIETRRSDITALGTGDLAGATLVTASALLDILTAEELTRLIDVVAGVRAPVFLTLSVVGRVEMVPADPLDGRFAAAFDAHQRRMTERGRLLGPDAAAAAAAELTRRRFEVEVESSPWRLGSDAADLLVGWLAGWVAAACEQAAELAGPAGAYVRRRLAQAAAGELAVTVGHADLLASPR